MSDLISRQAAIDVVEHITSSMSVCVNTDECHGMKRMQRQAVIELANLPSAQQWIPVTDGLPKEEKQVLVCDDFGEIYIAEYETFSDGKWRWYESVEYRSLYGIVAWMPLPDPWKGEEDDT